MGQSRVSEQVRYAVSPIVIAAWADVAEALGWPAGAGRLAGDPTAGGRES